MRAGKATVLVVEDDASIASLLRDLLLGDGYAVEVAATARAAMERMTPEVDVVVLDWMLPDGHGTDLVTAWRRRGVRAPIVFLTARATVVDKVLGLEIGADDYVTKPFEPRELLSRIKVRLRGHAAAAADEAPLCHGDVRLVRARREVTLRGAPVALTKMEFALLEVLLEKPGRVFTREELLNTVWGYDTTPTTRTVDTHVLQLRNKLGATLVESVRGVGYRVPRS